MKGYTTSRMPLAAYLRLKGYELQGLTFEGKRGFFVFDEVDLNEVMRFNNGNTQVEPNQYHEMCKQLVAMTRSKEAYGTGS
jgi:hypothetical protein